MKSNNYLLNFLGIYLCLNIPYQINSQDTCSNNKATCTKNRNHDKYSKESNQYIYFKNQIQESIKKYKPCSSKNCSCYLSVLEDDLKLFENKISKEQIDIASNRGVRYQIINHKLYRDNQCLFPFRCAGIEYFIKALLQKLPDLEIIINVRDWPQIGKYFDKPIPILSFSKIQNEFHDILYPAWSFWAGGPAIKLIPKGLGRWDQYRHNLKNTAKSWPWEKKLNKAFFRGSRTSSERDNLILLSRNYPDLVDALYTKNQAWQSDADTLHAPAAEEVSLEDHCKYRYLFNYRGVAASFRFKHLFMCKSLVFHVGDDWIEFFYPAMKPWVHYIPVQNTASQEELKQLIEFSMKNQDLVQQIAENGYRFISDNLKMEDIHCYWENLLTRYVNLLDFKPQLNESLIHIS